VVSVITLLNTKPRKKLNYKTPAEKMAEHVAALAA
jgi:IS30 family transposase